VLEGALSDNMIPVSFTERAWSSSLEAKQMELPRTACERNGLGSTDSKVHVLVRILAHSMCKYPKWKSEWKVIANCETCLSPTFMIVDGNPCIRPST